VGIEKKNKQKHERQYSVSYQKFYKKFDLATNMLYICNKYVAI